MDVGEMQRKLSLWAAQDKGHRFFDLYHLLYDRNWLLTAYEHVKHNAGSETAGCDGITMQDFDEHFDANVEALRTDLQTDKFEPHPVRRVYVPKSDGKQRPLGIPSVRDRIVQEALRMVLEPIFEVDFSPHSYGFRPNRCTMDAVAYLGSRLRPRNGNYFWIIEGDIAAYFDTVNHRKLLRCLKRRIKDAKILTLIWKFLRAGVMEKKLFRDTIKGVPQGGIVSPLLANVYLHELDMYMAKYVDLTQHEKHVRRKKGTANFLYARYADDFVVLCNGTKEQAVELKEELYEFLKTGLRLDLSQEKTKVTHVNDGFNFLGFRIERSIGQRGERVPKIRIPDKAIARFQTKIKETLAKSTHNDSVNAKILALNRIIGGWCRYYQFTSSASQIFNDLHHDVYWKMAHWLGRKYCMSIPKVMRKFRRRSTFATKTTCLKMPSEYKTKRYKVRVQHHPYTAKSMEPQREALFSLQEAWTGQEKRRGNADNRAETLVRHGFICGMCGKRLQWRDAEVDHKRPRHRFKRPEDADNPANCWPLCISCHKAKTKMDRQVLSRVR